jgi:hypothetical protein
MSQSHYHVFLPPTLSSLSSPIPRISFQDLVVSREVESQLDFGHTSQVSRIKRISQSQSQSQLYPSGNDRKGKSKQEPPEQEDTNTSTQYSWPPTPFEVIGSGNSSKKRLADEGDTSRGNTIKRSRAPLTLPGHTAHTNVTEDQDLSVGIGGGSGSGLRRKSSRVRRSGSGMSLRIFLHFKALPVWNPSLCHSLHLTFCIYIADNRPIRNIPRSRDSR